MNLLVFGTSWAVLSLVLGIGIGKILRRNSEPVLTEDNIPMTEERKRMIIYAEDRQ